MGRLIGLHSTRTSDGCGCGWWDLYRGFVLASIRRTYACMRVVRVADGAMHDVLRSVGLFLVGLGSCCVSFPSSLPILFLLQRRNSLVVIFSPVWMDGSVVVFVRSCGKERWGCPREGGGLISLGVVRIPRSVSHVIDTWTVDAPEQGDESCTCHGDGDGDADAGGRRRNTRRDGVRRRKEEKDTCQP